MDTEHCFKFLLPYIPSSQPTYLRSKNKHLTCISCSYKSKELHSVESYFLNLSSMSFNSPPLLSNAASLLSPFNLLFTSFFTPHCFSLLLLSLLSSPSTRLVSFSLSAFRPFQPLTNYPAVSRKQSHTNSGHLFPENP